jgi:hypothetical protein
VNKLEERAYKLSMQARTVLFNVLGSSAVYVIVAACSGADRQRASETFAKDGAGGSGRVDSAAALESGLDGALGKGGETGDAAYEQAAADASIVDALSDPVADAQADQAVSGTRLKARWYVSADGAKQFLGWFDSQRQENCSFQVAADGKTRCLPTTVLTFFYFYDPECKRPLAVSAPACPVRKYWADSLPIGSTCSPLGGTRVFESGAKIAPAAPVYQGGQTCSLLPQRPANLDFYSLTETAASSFQDASEQTN